MLRNKHKRFTVCPFLQLWPSVDSMKRHGWPITVTVYERESYISRHPHIYQTPTVRPREFPRWQSASRMLAGVRRFNRFHQSPSFSIFHICSQTVIKISCSFAARDDLRWQIFFLTDAGSGMHYREYKSKSFKNLSYKREEIFVC